jgi:hypothetical protein
VRLYLVKPFTKKGGRVAQSVGLEFKPQYCKKTPKKQKNKKNPQKTKHPKKQQQQKAV